MRGEVDEFMHVHDLVQESQSCFRGRAVCILRIRESVRYGINRLESTEDLTARLIDGLMHESCTAGISV